MIGTGWWFHNPSIPESVEFNDRYIAKYGGGEPSWNAEGGWEQLHILTMGMDLAGTTGGSPSALAKIADAWENKMAYATPRGFALGKGSILRWPASGAQYATAPSSPIGYAHDGVWQQLEMSEHDPDDFLDVPRD